jgi:hypothetical protein
LGSYGICGAHDPKQHDQLRLDADRGPLFWYQPESGFAVPAHLVHPELLLRAESHKVQLAVLRPSLVAEDGVASIGQRDNGAIPRLCTKRGP